MEKDLFEKTSSKLNDENEIDKLGEMTHEIQIICESLSRSYEFFQTNTLIDLIQNYIKKYERLLYSEISNYIFTLNDKGAKGNFITNVTKLVDYVLSNKFEEDLPSDKKEKDLLLNVKKMILKLWDHVNLAQNQFEKLKQTDDEFTKKFATNIHPIREGVQEEITKSTQLIISQLISLVGIFTAMSFLVFGGINSLDNIFSGVQSIPILQLMIIGCIWGLCILNLVFVFMFFISKMTKLDIRSNTSEDANLVERYPLVWWSNLIICTVLAMSLWLYYIDRWNLGGWLFNFSTSNQMVVSVLGFLIIIIIFIFLFIKIIKQGENKQKHKKNNKLVHRRRS